jgi:hypothetical protein
MEPAGVAGTSIAIVQLLSQVVVLGRALIEDIRNQEYDAATLTTRMSVALDRAEALQNLLFKRPADPNGTPVFDQLRHRNREDITAIFQQYHYLIHVRYRAFREAYELANPREKNAATLEKQNKWQVSWVFGGKKRFQTMVEGCEKLSEQLYEILELYILEKSLAERSQSTPTSPPFLDQLRRDENARYLQLDNQVDMIRISSGEESGTAMTDGSVIDLGAQQAVTFVEAASSSRRVGTYLGRAVLVEFKHFLPRAQDYHEGLKPQPSEVVMKRINQLAVLLNRPHRSSSRLLRCAGFYRSSESLSYGFILDFPSGRTLKPRTLLDIISADWSKAKHAIEPTVPLETRLNLALTLAVSVFKLHNWNWVHKSLRSENVLLFPVSEGENLYENLGEPWVAGFEYAREERDQSDTPLDTAIDVARDIYKHPQRWGMPTTRFGKLHDIYSLGVILLEIGLWQPVAALESSGFRNLKKEEREQVQSFLLKKAAQKLPFRVGTAYANIVEKCLTGNFEVEAAEGGMKEELYKDQVSQSISPGCAPWLTLHRLLGC